MSPTHPRRKRFATGSALFLPSTCPTAGPGPGRCHRTSGKSSPGSGGESLAASGLVAVSWPKEYGGGGLSPIEQVVLAEEFARAGAPERDENDLLGIDLLGNTLIALGSPEQKAHFLPRILSRRRPLVPGLLRARCRSDLAAVRTRAVLDGDEWVINGQKIWTSAGPTANWIFLLARTDPSVPKHQGPVVAAGAHGPARASWSGPSSMRPDTRRSVRSSSPMPAPPRQRRRRARQRMAHRDDPARFRTWIADHHGRQSNSAATWSGYANSPPTAACTPNRASGMSWRGAIPASRSCGIGAIGASPCR